MRQDRVGVCVFGNTFRECVVIAMERYKDEFRHLAEIYAKGFFESSQVGIPKFSSRNKSIQMYEFSKFFVGDL